MALGVNPRTGAPWLEATNDAVGFGAHAGGDGEDGIMHITEPGCRNNPVEVLEVKGPMLIESYGYRTDTGGLGKHRGGVGVSRVYKFQAPTTAIAILYKTTPPWGFNGGGMADPNHVLIDPGTDQEVRQGGSYNILEAGQGLANNTGGGGGWGNPLERDPAKVARDVRNGFVSLESARRDYGVSVDPETFQVNQERTAALRS